MAWSTERIPVDDRQRPPHAPARVPTRGDGLSDDADPAAAAGPTGDRSRIGVDSGSIGLCPVATGATGAFIEFAKGFALWDLLPGRLILESAGGDVVMY